MPLPPNFCRHCGEQEGPTTQLKTCAGCYLVSYCCKEHQANAWKSHKVVCKPVSSLKRERWAEVRQGKDAETQAERRALGTSCGDPDRMNQRAEEFAVEARIHKKAGRFDQAILLYSKAIELDSFHHEYFHHRSESWMLAVEQLSAGVPCEQHQIHLQFAIIDAQKALDLDGSFDIPWLTLVNVYLMTGDLDNMELYLDTALRRVKENDYSFPYLVNYRALLEGLRETPQGVPGWVAVLDPKDKYMMTYTNGMHNHHGKPELLVVDLEAANEKSYEKTLKWIAFEARDGNLDLSFGQVFRVPVKNGPWITPIPLSVMDRPEATRRGILPLLGYVQIASNICVLKFDFKDGGGETKPDALTKQEAQKYLQAIVDGAGSVATLYKSGQKLVTEDSYKN